MATSSPERQSRKMRGNYAKLNADDRKKLVDLVHLEYMSISAAAHKLGIARSTAMSIISKYDAHGTVELGPRGGCRKSLLQQVHIDFLRDLLDEDIDRSITTLKDRLVQRFGPDLDKASVHAIMETIKSKVTFTLKRIDSPHARQEPHSMAEMQMPWPMRCLQLNICYSTNCIFVDEINLHLSLVRARARSVQGQPPRTKAQDNRPRNISVIAAMSTAGVHLPVVTIGEFSAERLVGYCQQLIAETDRRLGPDTPPQHFVFGENMAYLSSTLSPVFRPTRHQLHFLPADASGLNATTEMFSRLYVVDREKTKNMEEVCQRLTKVLSDICASECQAWIAKTMQLQNMPPIPNEAA